MMKIKATYADENEDFCVANTVFALWYTDHWKLRWTRTFLHQITNLKSKNKKELRNFQYKIKYLLFVLIVKKVLEACSITIVKREREREKNY